MATGGVKMLPIEQIPPQLEWAHVAPARRVHAVGVRCLMGAVGMVLPGWTGIWHWLGIAAAIGLALLQIGVSACTSNWARSRRYR
ncbi:DoxX family protein [Streptacidiphilus sp. PAMC 29251]